MRKYVATVCVGGGTTLNNQQIALAAFLDIEDAFDNTLFGSLIPAVNHRVAKSICNWVKNMFHRRQVEAKLA